MKILVTGGAGFIGSHVVEALLAAGHQVVVVDDLSSGRRENVPAGARLEVMDIGDPAVAQLIADEGVEVIDHHAAQISVPASVQDPARDARVNVLGLLNLLEAGRRHGVRRVVFISSGGAVYGEPEAIPAPESATPRPLSPYAVTKRAGELYLAFYAHQYGMGTTVLRYANVYGPRQIPHGEAGVVAIFMDCLLAGRAPDIFRQDDMPRGMLRDYVYVGDCARANLLALAAPDGVYNIGTGLATDTLSLWEEVQRAGGRRLDHHFGPARPGDLRRSSLDWSLARRALGWRPEHDLAAGLAKTWAWRLALEG